MQFQSQTCELKTAPKLFVVVLSPHKELESLQSSYH